MFKKMFSLTMIVISLLLLLGGCSSTANGYSVENKELNEAIKELNFNPKVPTKLPFKPDLITADAGKTPMGEKLSINIKKHDKISIHFEILEIPKSGSDKITAKGGNAEKMKTEGGVEVVYGENGISWSEDHVTYLISIMNHDDEEFLSKEEKLSIVDGFE